MTDYEKIQMIALILGDIDGGPYYPMFTPEQYGQFLKLGKGNINKAIMYAAISATYFVSSDSSREQIGELSISNSGGTSYLKLLDHLKSTVGRLPPDGLMPWVAGADDETRNKLLDYKLCDSGIYPWTTRIKVDYADRCCEDC